MGRFRSCRDHQSGRSLASMRDMPKRERHSLMYNYVELIMEHGFVSRSSHKAFARLYLDPLHRMIRPFGTALANLRCSLAHSTCRACAMSSRSERHCSSSRLVMVFRCCSSALTRSTSSRSIRTVRISLARYRGVSRMKHVCVNNGFRTTALIPSDPIVPLACQLEP